MDHSAILGPALTVRPHLRPGERLVHATRRSVLHYAVDGHDAHGQPRRGLLARGAAAVGSGVGEFVGAAVLGGSDSGRDTQAEPDHLVLGSGLDTVAARHFGAVTAGARVTRVFALTTQRLLVFASPPAPEPSGGVGKALFGFAKDVVRVVADTRRTYGDHVEGEPVGVPGLRLVHELPLDLLAHHGRGQRGYRLGFTDGSAVEFPPLPGERNPFRRKQVLADEQVVREELTRFWLRPGERLRLGAPPVRGYVLAEIGGTVTVPFRPAGDLPALDLPPARWPLPCPLTQAHPLDWLDDPTVGYDVRAAHPGADAVRCAEHLAHSQGEARLVVTDARVAVVYPTRLLRPKNPPTPFTTAMELPASRLARLGWSAMGAELPGDGPRVVGLTFTDGSLLLFRYRRAEELLAAG
ncbi:hypothetical protein JOF53_001772 [Crossiella equi]|uniref:Uncharacterized protein n=1 Tax=Crossiella equi TaxID=130796 RepID=A0ABS5AB10_9PSEU|nr:hypothetical protein [Crossiella equi]MBP2472900.1 hypothetical protein [Crossiella equi]